VEFREALRLALNTLWSNRLRSFLTVLGNVVAVLSVVALVSVILGLNFFVSQQLLSTGSNSFTITK
jgi:putative ABC transport system permease protein